MAIILDADVIIRGGKGTFDLSRWAGSRPDEQFEMAAVTVAELRLKSRHNNSRGTRSLLDLTVIVL